MYFSLELGVFSQELHFRLEMGVSSLSMLYSGPEPDELEIKNQSKTNELGLIV